MLPQIDKRHDDRGDCRDRVQAGDAGRKVERSKHLGKMPPESAGASAGSDPVEEYSLQVEDEVVPAQIPEVLHLLDGERGNRRQGVKRPLFNWHRLFLLSLVFEPLDIVQAHEPEKDKNDRIISGGGQYEEKGPDGGRIPFFQFLPGPEGGDGKKQDGKPQEVVDWLVREAVAEVEEHGRGPVIEDAEKRNSRGRYPVEKGVHEGERRQGHAKAQEPERVPFVRPGLLERRERQEIARRIMGVVEPVADELARDYAPGVLPQGWLVDMAD